MQIMHDIINYFMTINPRFYRTEKTSGGTLLAGKHDMNPVRYSI